MRRFVLEHVSLSQQERAGGRAETRRVDIKAEEKRREEMEQSESAGLREGGALSRPPPSSCHRSGRLNDFLLQTRAKLGSF